MQFCNDCGSIMKKENEVMVCGSCARQEQQDESAEFVSTDEQDDSGAIESSEDIAFEGKPTAEEHCDNCGNMEAWYTIKQTASADEPPTRFFKCTECGNRWRDYN